MPLLHRAKAAPTILVAAIAGSVALSTPVWAASDQGQSQCTTSGDALRYVVVFDEGTPPGTARNEIDAACGRATMYYRDIAVAVATSAAPEFAERIGRERAFSAQRTYRARGEQDRSPTRHDHPAGRDGPSIPEPSGTEPERTDPSEVPEADRTAEQWNMRMIGAADPPRDRPGRRKITVGVLDSGIDPRHPELSGAVDPGSSAGCETGKPDTSRAAWKPSSSAHGTHVAGIIAAADDGKGVTGVAPGTRLASIKVVDDQGRINPEAAVCGLMWAAKQDIAVANSSFFVDPWLFACADDKRQQVVNEAISRAADYAAEQGTLNVAAATNENVNLNVHLTAQATNRSAAPGDECTVLPAGLSDVIAVSAVDSDGVKAGYSSYGLGVVDLTAPGGQRRQEAPGDDPAGNNKANEDRAQVNRAPGNPASADNPPAADDTASGPAATGTSGATSTGTGVRDTDDNDTDRRDTDHRNTSGEDTRSTDGCILSTVPGGYDSYCGTSMAAPHVSGVAALLAARRPTREPEQLRDLLTDRARSVACPTDYDLDRTGTQDAYCTGYREYNGFYGHGLVSARPNAPA